MCVVLSKYHIDMHREHIDPTSPGWCPIYAINVLRWKPDLVSEDERAAIIAGVAPILSEVKPVVLKRSEVSSVLWLRLLENLNRFTDPEVDRADDLIPYNGEYPGIKYDGSFSGHCYSDDYMCGAYVVDVLLLTDGTCVTEPSLSDDESDYTPDQIEKRFEMCGAQGGRR